MSFSVNEMEFRKKASNQFSHFVFFPSTTNEQVAMQQSVLVKENLGKILRERNIAHVIGAHYYHCLKQCGFGNETECITKVCDEQFGDKFHGKCPLISPPSHANATSNHMHILIYVSGSGVGVSNNNGTEDCGNNTSTNATSGTNWSLENAVQLVRVFFTEHFSLSLSDSSGGFATSLSGYHVLQKHVWCPFSVYTAFCNYQNSLIVIWGEIFLRKFKKAWMSNGDLRKYFPKRPPLLRSKTLWELHCHN